jgi:hypothetical protein
MQIIKEISLNALWPLKWQNRIQTFPIQNMGIVCFRTLLRTLFITCFAKWHNTRKSLTGLCHHIQPPTLHGSRQQLLECGWCVLQQGTCHCHYSKMCIFLNSETLWFYLCNLKSICFSIESIFIICTVRLQRFHIDCWWLLFPHTICCLITSTKLSLCLTKHCARKTHGGVDVQVHIFFALALDGGEWSASCSSLFTSRERAPDTRCIGGWVDLRAGLVDMDKWK